MPRDQESYQGLRDILSTLESLPPDAAILVEGKKDERCLRRMGISTDIIRTNSSQSLHQQLTPYSELVILTDYDRQGKQLAREAEVMARAFGVEPNLQPRKKLRRLTGGDLAHIEGLYTYMMNLKAELYGPWQPKRS